MSLQNVLDGFQKESDRHFIRVGALNGGVFATSVCGCPCINYYYNDILTDLNPLVLALCTCVNLENICTALVVLSYYLQRMVFLKWLYFTLSLNFFGKK